MFEQFTAIFIGEFIPAASLDLLRGSFLGCAVEIWNNAQLDHIHSNVRHSWTIHVHEMQHTICTV